MPEMGWTKEADPAPVPVGRRGRRIPTELARLVALGHAETQDAPEGGAWHKRAFGSRLEAENARNRIRYAARRIYPGVLAVRSTLEPAGARFQLRIQFFRVETLESAADAAGAGTLAAVPAGAGPAERGQV